MNSELNNELVIFAHGILRSGKDMRFLEKGIKGEGYATIAVNLPLTFGSLEDGCKSLHIQVARIIKKFNKVHFVGYSMGGLVIQKFLSLNPIDNLGNCIFIATPNRGSKLANIASMFPGVARIFKPLKDLTTNRKLDDVFKHHKEMKVGIIAGNKNKIIFSKLFMSPTSDGMVELHSAKLDNMHDYTDFPYSHNEIHFKEEVLSAVIKFIKHGKFS